MFYIHQTICIAPQENLLEPNIENIKVFENNKLNVTEKKYDGIPPAVLRRMGKAVRLGMGVGMPFMQSDTKYDGIIIGTANGGMEDCIKFLNQIMEYEEGTLTPTNFVQSTSNAIASQLAFFSHNKGYNTTNVHRGLAFETSLIDVLMLLKENPTNQYLLAGVDEMSTYNYNIDYLDNWYKKEYINSMDLYISNTDGSIAGEGAAMFHVNNVSNGALATFVDIETIHTESIDEINIFVKEFLLKNGIVDTVDLLLSGENGDARFISIFETVEGNLNQNTSIARFKHLTGEYQTSTSAALWIATEILHTQILPKHLLKFDVNLDNVENILIFNSYQGLQHSLILMKR